MNNSEISGIVVWALVAGGLAFVILDHNLMQPSRSEVTQWCIAAGLCRILYFASFILFNSRPMNTKSTLGAIFVGSPVLVCGLLLISADRLRKFGCKNR
jgi:hypothetical protein